MSQYSNHPSKSRMYIPAIALALLAAAGVASLVQTPQTRGTERDRSEASAAPVTSVINNGSPAPHVAGKSPVEVGRYIIQTAGCNDCHTPGWMQKGEVVPESEWLTGVPLGWRGPWGTTYAPNLRQSFKDMTDPALFVTIARARNSRPPMPWPSLHAMSDADLKAVFAYIKSLPVTGERMPDYCPPGVEPKTPWLSMEPQMPTSTQSESAARR